MTAQPKVFTYALLLFGIWAGIQLALFTMMFCIAPDPVLRALMGMVSGLGYVWIVCGGLLMWRFRESIRARVLTINLDWWLKFVLFATLLALTEEAITTSLTNLAPLFGVLIGRAYITASANYLDVVSFHSVIVLIPEFIMWAWLLSRYNFAPNAVFVLYGLTGMIGEILSFGPQNVAMMGFWVFVYGLMVYLPAYTLPSERAAQPVRLRNYVQALFLPLLLTVPVVLVIALGFHHPGIHFPPIKAGR